MSKIRPYIIHEHLTVQEIIDLINDAYDEGRGDGYEDGYKDGADVPEDSYNEGYNQGFKDGERKAKDEWVKSITITDPSIVTTPLATPTYPTTPTTPNAWPPNVIYCGNISSDEITTGDTV